MLSGNNSILQRAGEAKVTTENLTSEEELKIAIAGLISDYYTNNSSGTIKEYIFSDVGKTKLQSELIDTENLLFGSETITYKGATYRVKNDGTIEIPELTVGDYVRYDVTYEDIDTSGTYGKDNGWRLLNKTINTNGTYDIEIISSGIPAGIIFYPPNVNDIEWIGNETQREAYHNQFYVSKNNNESNRNMKEAAGLYYNLKNITFKHETKQESFNNNHYNYGFYTKINGKTEDEISGEEFITPNTELPKGVEAKVRSITLADIYPIFTKLDYITIEENIKYVNDIDSGYNKLTSYTTSSINTADKAEGLFILQDYTPDSHTSRASYILASPYSGNSYDMYIVYQDGCILSGIYGAMELRPIISITGVKLSFDSESELWIIN